MSRGTGARFVIATNRDLRAMVSAGGFRADLYYRIQTHEIRLPPLRERREDLLPLTDRFLDEAGEKLGKPRLALPPQLGDLLASYDFPGNVRELRSMVFAAVSRQKSRMLSLDAFREAMGRGASRGRSRRARPVRARDGPRSRPASGCPRSRPRPRASSRRPSSVPTATTRSRPGCSGSRRRR